MNNLEDRGGSVTFTPTFQSIDTWDKRVFFTVQDSLAMDAAFAEGKMIWLQLPQVEGWGAHGCKLLIIGASEVDSGEVNSGKVFFVTRISYGYGTYILNDGVRFDTTTNRYYVQIYVD